MEQARRPARFRFGDFTLDLAAYQLRRGDRVVRLERRPMDLLILLVERRGELVTRGEIADRLWGADVFVDVENGVNTAVRKVRAALRDPADTPVFVETVPGRGYRFVAAVEAVGQDRHSAAVPPAPAPGEGAAGPGAAATPLRAGLRRWLVGIVGLVLLVLTIAWIASRPVALPSSLTLAVLPFENLTGDPERAYLADGLTEETIQSLAQIDPLRVRVIGRTSMMGYRGTTRPLAEIGRELHADYLVEGSVRAEASRVRIVTRLVRAADQVPVWAHTWDRLPSSLLGLQGELSAVIAEQVRLRLTPDRAAAVSRRAPQRPDAYDLYLRGRFHHSQLTPQSVGRGLEYYQQAVDLDPSYALAWAGMATALVSRPINSDVAASDVAPRARDAVRRALAAAPDLAEAQAAAGHVAFMLDWRWPEAERALRRATILDPSSSFAHLTLGHTLSQMGRHDEARAHTALARRADPLYPLTHAISSQVEFQAGDLEAALRHARDATVIDPEFWIGHMQEAQALLEQGRHDAALAALAQAARFSGGNSKALSLRGYALAIAGRTEEARRVLDTLRTLAADRYVPPYALALVHAGLGERDAALAALEQAVSVRDVHCIFLPVDPKWRTYREEPRFVALLARSHLLAAPAIARR